MDAHCHLARAEYPHRTSVDDLGAHDPKIKIVGGIFRAGEGGA
jgi:hypothetical protein